MTRRPRAVHAFAPVAIWLAGLALALPDAPAVAQSAQWGQIYVDTAAAVDTSFDDAGRGTTGVIVDGIVEAGLGKGLQLIGRPFAQRLGSGEWNRQVWIAALRYERPGRLGVRIDGGLIPPPVGLANLTLRPHLSPTVSQPTSLFQPLPPLEPGAPRATLLGNVYPFGGSVTVSATRWDARAAVIDASPLRPRRVFTPPNGPPRFTNVVVGGGVTPVIGLRVGGSVTRGGWRRAGENAATLEDRTGTVYTLESEFSFRYTKVAAEWTHDRVELQTGGHTWATGWFVVAQQTVSPRWFVAARVERMGARTVDATGAARVQHFDGIEPVIGYRLTPDVTLRGGYRARRAFAQTAFDHQIVVSAVLWRRWL